MTWVLAIAGLAALCLALSAFLAVKGERALASDLMGVGAILGLFTVAAGMLALAATA